MRRWFEIIHHPLGGRSLAFYIQVTVPLKIILDLASVNISHLFRALAWPDPEAAVD